MINLLLTILKVLGIIILCILGILLLVALCVLLIPLRYWINGEYDESFKGRVKLTWFFHIISFSFIFENEPKIRFRVFGIPISFHKKEKVRKSNHKETKSDDNQPDLQACEEKTNSVKAVDEINDIKDKEVERKKNENSKSADKPEKKESIGKRIINFVLKIINKIKALIHKIKEILSNINYYIDIYNRKETKKAIHTCKIRLLKLYKSIRPKKLKIRIYYGLEDPSNTAKILSFYSMLYAYIGNIVYLFPDFQEPMFKAYVNGKGKIIPVRVGYHIIRVFLDKNCRRLIQMLKKENLNE